MRASNRGLFFLANKIYSDNLLPANGSGSGGAFGNFNPITRSGNTLTANTTPANGFYYRADVKPNTVYRVTSPQPAVPLTGSWRISIAFSNDGTSLASPLDTSWSLFYNINSTEFFFLTSSLTVKVDVILERFISSGSTDSCLFYGFSMFEVLPPANKTYSNNLLPANGSSSGAAFGNFNPMTRSGNTLTANTTPANGFYYRADVKPSTVYRVTSPQSAVPLTGTWRISVAFSNDGTSFASPLNTYNINSTEFFFLTSPSTVKVDVILERFISSGSTDSCLFYGFSMFEVLS
jgi:hypothetical protein